MARDKSAVNKFFYVDATKFRRHSHHMTNAPQLIREWLHAEGRKQRWLAARVPVTEQTLSGWLAGRIAIGGMGRARLADITGLPVADVAAWRKEGENG